MVPDGYIEDDDERIDGPALIVDVWAAEDELPPIQISVADIPTSHSACCFDETASIPARVRGGKMGRQRRRHYQ